MGSIVMLFYGLEDYQESAGAHAPSLHCLSQRNIKVKIDACFLLNPYVTDVVIRWLKKRLKQSGIFEKAISVYPAQNSDLAIKISKIINVDKNCILVGNGSIEIIQSLMQNVVEGKTVINIPTFSTYYESIKNEADVVFYKLKKENNFQLEIEKYLEFIKINDVKNAIIINPNNPDGSYLQYNQLDYLLNKLSNLKNIIIDESFIHFVKEDKNYRLVNYCKLFEKYKNLIIIKSLSKDYGIPGLRLGYAVMDDKILQSILKKDFLWNINGFAEIFIDLLGDGEFQKEYERQRIRYIKEIERFYNKLKTIGKLKVFPTKANFVLVELPGNYTSGEVANLLLLKYGIYVRDCSNKIGLDGNFLRIGVRKKKDNDYIINCLKEIIN